MAYIAPSYDDIRKRFLDDPANGPRVTPPSFVSNEGGAAPASSAPPPVSTAGGGGRFAALRGFLEANKGTANDQATTVAKGIEATAQDAVKKADESSRLPENYGGFETATQAAASRDEALDKVRAAQGEGASELFGNKPDARYSAGERAADSALYSRTEAFQNLGKWDPVLSALEPTYKAPYYEPEKKNPPPQQGGGRRRRDNWSWLYRHPLDRQYWSSLSDFGDSAGDVVRRVGDKVGDAVRAADPTTWF